MPCPWSEDEWSKKVKPYATCSAEQVFVGLSVMTKTTQAGQLCSNRQLLLPCYSSVWCMLRQSCVLHTHTISSPLIDWSIYGSMCGCVITPYCHDMSYIWQCRIDQIVSDSKPALYLAIPNWPDRQWCIVNFDWSMFVFNGVIHSRNIIDWSQMLSSITSDKFHSLRIQLLCILVIEIQSIYLVWL